MRGGQRGRRVGDGPTVPSFELNRRWVWSGGGRRPRVGQVVPYVLLSFSGLVISSIAVHLASDATATSTRLVHTVAIELANLTAYGGLWLIQFVLCDRILFTSREHRSDPAAVPAVGHGGTERGPYLPQHEPGVTETVTFLAEAPFSMSTRVAPGREVIRAPETFAQ